MYISVYASHDKKNLRIQRTINVNTRSRRSGIRYRHRDSHGRVRIHIMNSRHSLGSSTRTERHRQNENQGSKKDQNDGTKPQGKRL